MFTTNSRIMQKLRHLRRHYNVTYVTIFYRYTSTTRLADRGYNLQLALRDSKPRRLFPDQGFGFGRPQTGLVVCNFEE